MWGKALKSKGSVALMHMIRNGKIHMMAAFVSATYPCESVLPIRLRPDFYVVFEGYAGGSEH
jgi:hypothetical protein